MNPEQSIKNQEKPQGTSRAFPNLWILIRAVGFILASWILVHIFALLGVFVSLAYPLWYLLAPQSTVCFLCRFHSTEYKCPLCKRITKPGESVVPGSLLSAMANGFILFVFSLISLGFVYTEKIVLNELGIPPTEKTVTFVIPDEGQYKIEEIFSMEIKVQGIKVPVNAIQADIKFDQDRVEIIDIITDYSFADVFIQKSINNGLGYARLTGGLPDPGYAGEEGIFGTVLFKGKSPGVVTVEFLPTSLVLANDGRGTNVLKDYAESSYLILPEHLTADEVSLQNNLLDEEVLGSKSDKTKLEFYDEDDSEVLGIQDSISDDDKIESGFSLWDIIEAIDSFIVAFWDWVAGLFD